LSAAPPCGFEADRKRLDDDATFREAQLDDWSSGSLTIFVVSTDEKKWTFFRQPSDLVSAIQDKLS
jgi:hypothetical protein